MSLLATLEFVAVAVSAIYGILLAARRGMDFVGVFAVAFVAAFGGGTLRDLFLDRVPLFWIANPHYLLAALFGVITGTFGGVLAEIVCSEIPILFKAAPFCAICNLTLPALRGSSSTSSAEPRSAS